VKREASNPSRGRIRFQYTFRHSLAQGRRGLVQRDFCILDLFFSYGRLDLLYKALESTQRRMITVVPLYRLTGSANCRFVYNRHSRLPWKRAHLYHKVL
jgi:hypothetical protein